MEIILGNDWKLYIGIAPPLGGGTWMSFDAEISSSLNLNAEAIETTTKANTWKTFIAGAKSGTVNVTAYADNFIAPFSKDYEMNRQILALKQLVSGSKVMCLYGSINSVDSVKGYQFEALITSISESSEKGNVVSRDMTLQITGEVVPVGLIPEATTNE